MPGNGEEPAIQFGTDFPIGLQQHLGRRRHEHDGHHDDEAGECGNHPEDDQPYALRTVVAVRGGILRGSGAHVRVGLSRTSTSAAAVCAAADSPAKPGRRGANP